MRFVSWNVNGIRAVLKKNFLEVFDAFDADIFAIQETKCQVGQVQLDLPGYHQYWSAAEKKGYSGTAVFTREEPLRVLHGLGTSTWTPRDASWRCEFPAVLVRGRVHAERPERACAHRRTAWSGTTRSATSARGSRPACCPPACRLQRPAPGEGHVTHLRAAACTSRARRPRRSRWSCAATSTWRIRRST